MQCKKVLEEKDAEPKPDEDGPASSEGAEDVRDITDDESMSDSGERPDKPHGAIYGGYFEQTLGSWGSRASLCIVPSHLPPSRHALPTGNNERRSALFTR